MRSLHFFFLLLISPSFSAFSSAAEARPPLPAGVSPLMLAAQRGDVTEIVTWLLDCGADLRQKDKNGRTVLHDAAVHGRTEIARYLLGNCNCDLMELVNTTDSARQTPLHLAALHKHQDVAELFLQHGAGVNEQNAQGQTALLLLVEKENIPFITMLLQHGADPEISDKNGRNAFYYAPWDEAEMIVRLLKEERALFLKRAESADEQLSESADEQLSESADEQLSESADELLLRPEPASVLTLFRGTLLCCLPVRLPGADKLLSYKRWFTRS